MSPPSPFDLTSAEPGAERFACLRRDFERRRRKFLRMMAAEHEDAARYPRLVPAAFRKFLLDRDVTGADPAKAWVRLRTPPTDDWRKRLTQANRDAKRDRTDKKATLWTDDAIARDDGLWAGGEEDVNVVSARLVITVLEANAAMEELEDPDAEPWNAPPFPPPIFYKLPKPDERATTRDVARAIAELQVVQVVAGPLLGKDVKDVLRARVEHIVMDAADAIRLATMPHQQVIDPISGAAVLPKDRVAELILAVKPALGAFLDALHLPTPPTAPEERSAFISRWIGRFAGADPALLLDAFGFEHATTLLELKNLCPTSADVKRVVDLHAWLASLATLPLRDSLPALSDLTAFGSEPTWDVAAGAWSLTQHDFSCVSPAPAPEGSVTAGEDTLYRTLVFQGGPAAPDKMRFFRRDPAPMVPPGWTWPAHDPDFIYWWNAILRRHCAEHLLYLKDTADFHATDLLRFCYLFDLFGTKDARVPQYVADGCKASLLYFKYWFDEPAAEGNKGGEMTFWSENHQIQFHASQFLVGQLFPDEVFPRSGQTREGRAVTGAEHLQRGRERLERWLDRRLSLGFSEWNSPGYYNEDFPPVLNVVDFSRDERLATKAAMVVDLLVFDLARNTCRGSFGVTAGRAYFEHKGYGWEQSVGETIEVLFGTRGDHLRKENTAIALCTSTYEVPDALLAIGRDRVLVDSRQPMEFRARVSIDPEEGGAHGVGFDTDDDAAFWWGLGAYVDPATIELTRRVAPRHDNLESTNPPALLFKLDLFGGFLKALLLDTAEMVAGGALAAGSSLLVMAAFPLNLAAAAVYLTSVELMIQGLVNLIGDLAVMIKDALEWAWDLATGQEPPEPDIPQPALQRAWEAMLQTFNGGNVLGRANLYTYAVGDAMLSSVQNHRARQISFQKQPWMASLGCDACVFTNAPMDPGASVGTAGWEVFKHLATGQVSRAMGDIAGIAQLGLDDIKDEGLRDWGGSICLPKVAQHRGAAIIAYDFPPQRGTFSATYTHAWFPCEFFDEVTPAPTHDDWLPQGDGGATWVFARKDDGYIALCSARRVRWLRDERFKDDPDPASDGTIGARGFTTTELRADDGSNIWVCAVGNKQQFGSFEAFTSRVLFSYLHFSGVGALGQLQCTFDMPAAAGTSEPGFRWELFFDDDEARLDGQTVSLDGYPRFAGRYVEGRTPGRVEWGEGAYRLVHPTTGLWVAHDVTRAQREPGPPQRCVAVPRVSHAHPGARAQVALTANRAARLRGEPAHATTAGAAGAPRSPRRTRRERFRLERDD